MSSGPYLSNNAAFTTLTFLHFAGLAADDSAVSKFFYFICNLHSKPDIAWICRFGEMLGQGWPNDMGDNCGVPESWQTTMTGVSGVLMFLMGL